MTEKRFLLEGSEFDLKYEFRVADLSRVEKTKEDFWNEKEERYDYFDYIEYLYENNAFLTEEDADKTFNGLHKENKELQHKLSQQEMEYTTDLYRLVEENEQLKSKNRGLESELQIFKEDVTHSNLQINKLTDENEELKQQLKTRVIVNKQYEELQRLKKENEQLKKDATTLIYANQDYRQQNQNLQKQLDYIQNSISEHIKHQKTELGQKALREVIQDYNDWLLGHKEVKE